MKINWLQLNGFLLAVIAACSPTPSTPPTLAPTASPIPPTATPVTITLPEQPVAHNADWTPVVQAFDGVEMALVPPGCFIMGHEEGRRDERPEHEICFDQPYWIDRTEVTNAQYGSTGHGTGENQPRENLLWSEARDFCAARGGRLPTEAEWEYAARGPDNLLYLWGSDLEISRLVFDRNTPGQTVDVGSRPSGASWVGALDMAGNVFEWVSSIYARYPYDANDGREDVNDTTSLRVYRGGIYSYLDYAATATIRFRISPTERDWFIGFRCARDAE
ncbi:MAG: formylglycine-generating enzyme family protein [Anaerolineae bacterium]|nr:formylglycine-generating enzyme family protein [Anaerolineae bacterium]